MAKFFNSKSVLEDKSTRSLKQSVKGIDVDSYVSGITGDFKAVAYFIKLLNVGLLSEPDSIFDMHD